jgi:hypothetical protein
VLELGEELLASAASWRRSLRDRIIRAADDGVQVGAVRWQEKDVPARLPDGAAGGLAFVAAEVV